MAAHTPGPWLMRRTGAGCSGTRGWAIDFNEDQEQVVDFVYEEADARLIAAAPDLLIALRDLLHAYSTPNDRVCCDGRDCGCMGITEHQQAEHYAEEAIAKATGGAN